jgi:UPF0176 protein
MSHSEPYYCLAYYQFSPINDPHGEVLLHKEYLSNKDAKSRIYISEEGINGQMSASREDALKYIDWMHSRPEFANVHFKIHEYHEHAFPRLQIKYRKKLVALDQPVNITLQGEHLPPEKWKEMLASKDPYVLLDIRNDYEWKVGHFKGAELPPCETFRDFRTYVENLNTKIQDKKTPVMMYCTGGIRCELYSAVLKENGFDQVYQLEGGIINYGLKEGSEHWLGKLFVFDDRLTVPISEEETPVIGQCAFCEAPTESYYNCANVECNHLYLCCPSCLKELVGCCSHECTQAPRIRPYHEQNPHKPFRKWHHYTQT